MTKTFKSLMVAAMGLTLIVAAPMSSAQNDPRDKIIASLELQSADVRDALSILFKNVEVSYTVAADVQGTVTVNLKNQTFEVVLQAILKQADATYRVEGGIYNIIKKEVVAPPPPGDTGGPTVNPQSTTRIYKLRIRHADPQYVFNLLSNRSDFTTEPEISSRPSGNAGGGGFGGGQGGGGFGGGGFGQGGGGFGGGQGGGGFGGGGFGGGGGGFGGGGGGFGGGGGGGRGGRGG